MDAIPAEWQGWDFIPRLSHLRRYLIEAFVKQFVQSVALVKSKHESFEDLRSGSLNRSGHAGAV